MNYYDELEKKLREKKREILSITDYKAALLGEIYGFIGHNPTDEELELFEEYAANYIADCINDDKRPDLSGMACALLDCKDENFVRCVDCGDCYLRSEMNQDYGCEYCLECKPYKDEDLERELADADRDYLEHLNEIG